MGRMIEPHSESTLSENLGKKITGRALPFGSSDKNRKNSPFGMTKDLEEFPHPLKIPNTGMGPMNLLEVEKGI